MKLVSGTIMQYFNRRIMLVLTLAGLLLPSSLAAQAIFINDATLHTMGRQSVLQQADLLIRDGRIRSVGLDLSAPADATVIEALKARYEEE